MSVAIILGVFILTNKIVEILDALNTPVLVHIEGKLLYANDEFSLLLGYNNPNELFDLKNIEVTLIKDSSKDRAKYFKRNGSAIELCQAASKIDWEGLPASLISFTPYSNTLDATNEKERNTEVSRARFMTAMSHEMMTPLHALLNVAELLKQTNLTDNQKELIDISFQSAQQLLFRVEDVLEFSNLEIDFSQTELSAFNPKESIENILANYEKQAHDKGLNFNVNLAPESNNSFMGSKDKLLRIVSHMVSNAVKYTEFGDIEINVAVGNDGRGIEIEVSDTGEGISPERLNTLFDAFQFDSDPTKRSQGGFSIGLALSRRMARSLGGDLTIDSNIGFGTVSNLYVPFEALGAVACEENYSDEAEQFRILIVEDNPTNQKVLTMVLNQLGHDSVCVDDGKQGVDIMQQANFDLILMDLHMPVMDGYEATRRIRENGHDLPIIALTADHRPEAKQLALGAGMDGFLTKPLEVSKLFEFIGSLTAAGDEDEFQVA